MKKKKKIERFGADPGPGFREFKQGILEFMTFAAEQAFRYSDETACNFPQGLLTACTLYEDDCRKKLLKTLPENSTLKHDELIEDMVVETSKYFAFFYLHRGVISNKVPGSDKHFIKTVAQICDSIILLVKSGQKKKEVKQDELD